MQETLIADIQISYRFRSDYVRAEGDLNRRLQAIWRRSGISNAPKSSPEARARLDMMHELVKARQLELRALSKRGLSLLDDEDDGEGLNDGADGQSSSALSDSDQRLVNAVFSYTRLMVDEMEALRLHRMREFEKPMVSLAGQLPAWPWVEETKGISAVSFASIVGEAGDLSGYPTHSKLWKRMGLAVLPDGKRQRRIAGVTEEEARAIGYSPSRRAVMWVIGDNLIRANNPEYRAIYDQRKAYERARDPEMSAMFAHRRAHRYMEKRFLRDLWQAWRAAERVLVLDEAAD